MQKLFGTDGIRGRAGEFPLDEKTVRIIGASLGRQFRERLGRTPRFVSGRDTRESGEWIEAAFQAGVMSENAECRSAGIITTPGVAYLTKASNYDAGIVISASHNPFYDNGIKIFLPTGLKIDEAAERLIEQDIYDDISPAGVGEPQVDLQSEAFHRIAYSMHLLATANQIQANSIKIVLDCANGAASKFARKIFKKCGGGAITINDHPNGRNINENSGSLHLEQLQAKVLEENANLGVAFDGDADRALFVDEKGNIVDGDATLWIMAQYLKAHGKLTNSTVVATVMSNIGLEIALKSKGIKLLRTNVGDKYVLDELLRSGFEIGGEQSGHIIFPEISLVGDGMMTALQLLKAITEKGIPLSQMTNGFVRYPQILLNVKVREKRPFDEIPEILAAAKKIEDELDGSSGRLLLRYSGTENLARVMIEGRDQEVINEQANRLADVIRSSLG